NLLIVLEHINIAILKKLLNPVTKAKNYRISPFCITYANLISSSDVFPVKFLSMQWSYKVLWGSDVLGELKISREHIRLRCEQEIKNLLLSLTRFYLFQIDRTLTKTIYRTYKFFLECLRVLVSLKQGDLPSHSEVIDVAERTLDLDTEVLHKIKTLRKSNKSLSDKEVEQLYDELISILNKAAQIADKIG
ncbi:MAG: hypothetical protein OEZ36_13110, partial [Spirochaetota bacterium]|nr:hypothetical protein [Spirochaetota bacterium]